jgi:hypothetical protein
MLSGIFSEIAIVDVIKLNQVLEEVPMVSKHFLFKCMVMLVVFTVGAYAQVSGSLTGAVKDPSGAVVPDATVKVFISGGNEPVLSGTTNEVGLFNFSAVRPETYDLAIEAKGFAKARIAGIRVAPLREYSVGDIKLQIAKTDQTVVISVDLVPTIPTSSEISTTITAEQVQNLPVLGRQVSNLFATLPGVSSGSNTTSVNGLRSSYTNLTLDGINIQDNFIRTNDLDYMPMRTTIDQVAEITASTSNETASIGGGASQIILSTKSGSNAYHGALYWYNRSNRLAANDYFNNRDGVEKPSLNLNQFGGALGGHLLKDKLFFYTNVELFRDRETSTQTRTVLTPDAKNGIFTYKDSAGVIQKVPLSSKRTFTLDPTTKALMDQLPAPNSTGGDGYNTSGYRFNARDNEFRDQVVYRGDYYKSSKQAFSWTYNYINNPTDRPDVTTSFYTTVPKVSNTLKNHVLSLGWRWSVSPRLTNELRGGFARTKSSFDDSNSYPKLIAGGLLFSNPVNTFLQQGRQTNTYPIQNNANWIKGNHQIMFGFQYQRISTAPFNDAGIIPTYTLGISSANSAIALTSTDLPGIKSADLTRANSLYANLAGNISSGAQTFNVTSTTSGFVPGATQLRRLNYSTYAGYFQDNWKLRPNLTLNLGLRYEIWKPVDEENSLYLAPVFQNNDVKATLLDPNAVLDFYGKSVGRPFYKTDKNNLAPNVGFAWNVPGKSKIVVRGGYMLAYVNDNVITTVRNNVATSSGLAFPNTITNQTALLSNPPAIPAPTYKVPRTLADNYAISKTSATGIPDPNLSTPMIHQWNLTLQREYKGLTFVARYLGNKGQDLLRAIDYNQVLYNANGFLADFKRAQSNAALSESAGKGFIGDYNSTIAGSQQLTVFPLLTSGGQISSAGSSYNSVYLRQGNIGEMANQYMVTGKNGSVNFYTNPNVQGANTVTNGGSSIYHAMQLETTKRMRGGSFFQFSYAFGKGLSNAAGDGNTNFEPLLDNANPSLEWARTPYDLRHVLKANYYYELPFGKGKKWGHSLILDKVIGGWAFTGIWNYQSGAPYSILSTWGTLNRDARSASTNTASLLNTTAAQLSSLTTGVWKSPADGTVYFLSPTLISSDGMGTSQPGDAPFQGQVFSNPGPGTVGNMQRRMFSGPWIWSWDISLKKSFVFYERHTLDFHFDFFNWMNHPTFYIPPSTAGDYGSNSNYNINNSTFGQIDSMQSLPRVIQIGLYYKF